MSSTNKTANYNLPQFIGTDKPSWLGDVNQAMSIIDGQMKTNADNIASASGEVNELETRVGSAETSVSSLNTRVGTTETQVSNLAGNVSNLNTSVTGLISQLNLNQITNATIELAGGRSFHVTLAQNEDGTLFKFYGLCYIDNNTASSISLGNYVSIPGSNNAYGIATGLTLNKRPSSAYTIECAGYTLCATRGYSKTATDYMDAGNMFNVLIMVGTDGQIYVALAGNDFTSTATPFPAYTRSRIFWLPMLYWNGDFGDEIGG